MFLLRFLRYLQGYVRFEVRGGFVERFLNLLARDRIPIWDGHKRGGRFSGYTLARHYHRLRKHVKKTGVRVRITGKYGLPFHRRKYRRRTGLLIGVLLFFSILGIMSRFIWRIEVNGLESVSESHVIKTLAGLGIKPGTLRSKIDVRKNERLALLALHELSWVALNIDGSTIYVEVKESTPPPELADPSKPCNIIAAKAGQIIDMNVYAGQALVREGDTVMEGEIIVSGITEDRLGQNLFRHAQADVLAEVQHDIHIDIPLSQTLLKDTGEMKRRGYLTTFGIDLPVFLPSKIPQPYRIERERKPFNILSFQLPVSWLQERYILQKEVPVQYTAEEAKQLALEELKILQQAQLADAEIIDKQLHGKLENNVFSLHAVYICQMDIGFKQEILVQPDL